MGESIPIKGFGFSEISGVAFNICNTTGNVNCSLALIVKMISPVYGLVLAVKASTLALIPTEAVPLMVRLPPVVLSSIFSHERLLLALAQAVHCKGEVA